ncbi:MAG: thiolase family protein [Candidatus Thermoplasmatota archaeon]|jgi:acetyl-CoA acetyltransferase|nr:thiolase family protein [Candidatus Thermoplasmatota archaeon]MCL5785733.1 thiolase family protein [Candidatus Thermoplasmatota archaeon]
MKSYKKMKSEKGRVAVVGTGQTRFEARTPLSTYFELALEASSEAVRDAGITFAEVDSVVYGIYNDLFERQIMPDTYVHDYLGLYGKPGTRVTTGGATGGYAFRSGFAEIASGLADVTLVIGVEKAQDCYDWAQGKSTPEVLKSIAYSADMTWEFPLGTSAASSYAILASAHMRKYGTTEEQAAMVSVKNHGNAFNNPYAQSPMKISVDDVMASRMISYPFKMLDCSLYTEGAYALVLMSENAVRRRGLKDPVWVLGIGSSNDKSFTGSRSAKDRLGMYGDIADLRNHYAAANGAYEMAGIADPGKGIDVAELHDAFSFTEIQGYEAMGFCRKGEGGKFIENGVPLMKGDLPVSPSGGLIGAGHAVGATGVMQIGEVANQLRSRAGKRQVEIKNGKGLAHSIGGPGSSYCSVSVLGVD